MAKYIIANTIWSFDFTEDHKKIFKKFEIETTEEAMHSIEFYQVDEFLNGGIDEMIDALNAADRAARLSEEE